MITINISNLSLIVDRYDYFVFDVFGIIHDGIKLTPGILEVLEKLHQRNKQVFFLSNSPQLSYRVEKQLIDLGINRNLFSGIQTSGDLTAYFLTHRPESWHQNLGSRCFFIGSEETKEVLPTPGFTNSESISNADFVLVTGAFDDSNNLDDYKTILKDALSKNLPLVCDNPDLFIIFAGHKKMRAGAIASQYQAMGGKVFFHGKPYIHTYNILLKKIDCFKNNILLIGDSLHTDIAGANICDIDSLLSVSEVTTHELGAPKEPLSFDIFNTLIHRQKEKFIPTYFCSPLRW